MYESKVFGIIKENGKVYNMYLHTYSQAVYTRKINFPTHGLSPEI